MPVNRKDYGPDWDDIAHEVKAAADWCCEWCGAPHLQVIRRTGQEWGQWQRVEFITETTGAQVETSQLSWKRLKYHRLVRVILTTAHLDRDHRNHDRNNLAALCQRCHLRHDIRQHIANRRYGRYHTREHQLTIDFAP